MFPIFLKNSGDFYIISLIFSNVKSLNYNLICDNLSFLKVYYRYSIGDDSNDKVYSFWEELNFTNLNTIDFNNNYVYNFQFKFVNVSNPSSEVVIKSFDVFKEDGVLINNFIPIETGSVFGLVKDFNSYFKPYDVNQAIHIQKELNYYTNKIFGWEIQYFRTNPLHEATDYMIMEYTLFNVEPPKCVKVMVPDNELPDSKLNYNPFGIEFETFQIQIDKNYFEDIFGYGSSPQPKDVLYFPNLGRIYEISSSYIFKGIMGEDLYWVINLVKYQPSASRIDDANNVKKIKNELPSSDNFNSFGDFNDVIKDNYDISTKPKQDSFSIGDVSDDIDMSLDPVRLKFYNNKDVNFKVSIVDYDLSTASNVISRYYYDVTTLTKEFYNLKFVEYKKNSILKEDSNYPDFGYSSFFKFKKPNYFLPNDNIQNYAITGNTMTIVLDNNRKYIIGDYIKIKRGDIIFYGVINNVINDYIYDLEISDDVLNYLSAYHPYWNTLNGYTATFEYPVNLIDGYDYNNDLGILIDMIAFKFFNIKINNDNYFIPVNNLVLDDDWYAVYVNLSNKFKQLNLSVFKREYDGVNNLNSDKLINVYNYNKRLVNKYSWELNNINYGIKFSNILITNIRIYKQICDLDNQPIILSQYTVNDSNLLLIADNALPINKLKLK